MKTERLNKPEIFNSICPQNPIVKKHIAYYYFHETRSDNFYRKFTYYPNYRVALNVFKGSDIRWQNENRFTLPAKDDEIKCILTYSKSQSRTVEMQGRINKIGIIFEPLGINYFTDKPLEYLVKDTITPFNGFGQSFNELALSVYDAEHISDKRDLLDNYFLERFRHRNVQNLSALINEIKSRNGSLTVSDLAKMNYTSRRTLLRQFNTHLMTSVKQFSNLVKFRNALDLYKMDESYFNLGKLAHLSDYYDQANFTKQIRTFTGCTPSQLLQNRTDVGGEYTLWTLNA